MGAGLSLNGPVSVLPCALGCYPLTGAVESEAATLTEVIQEMLLTTTSERQGRAIDHESAGSMEKKKQEGYF